MHKRTLRLWTRAVLVGAACCGILAAAQPQAATQPTSASKPTSKPTGPERWEQTIRGFEEKDKASPPPQGAVLFVGSSSIVKWDLPKCFPDLTLIKRGFGGSMLSEVVFYMDRIVLPYKAKTIVLYAGDNDIAAKRTPQDILKDYQTFVRKVRAAQPQTRIIYICIKPSIQRWKHIDSIRKTNALIQEEAKKDPLVTFLDVFPQMLGADGMPRKELLVADGLHMNEEGYKVWTSLLTPLLQPAGASGK